MKINIFVLILLTIVDVLEKYFDLLYNTHKGSCMLKILDSILLSDRVVEEFYKNYSDDKFKSWLNSILPEVEACRTTEQDNPWHIYNCLDHILHSVEEINKQSTGLDYNLRRVLAYTMFLHDAGKPECKIRRYAKAYKREVDSFFNHNIASVKIGERVLADFGFNQEDIATILSLVKNHDVFMNLTLEPTTNPYKKMLTKDVLQDIIGELGEDNGRQLMQYLIMVGRADNMAQNPKMTGQALKLLDVMENMFTEVYGNQIITNK